MRDPVLGIASLWYLDGSLSSPMKTSSRNGMSSVASSSGKRVRFGSELASASLIQD